MSEPDVPECLRRLTPEEAALVEPLSDEVVDAALEEGRRAAEAMRDESRWRPARRAGEVRFVL